MIASIHNKLRSKGGHLSKYQNFAKQWLPWIAAILIFIYLFWQTDMVEFYTALLKADIGYYIFSLVLFCLIAYLVDAQNIHSILLLFHHPISFKEVLLIRGKSYILMGINYVAGMGAISYYLYRDNGIPVIRSTGLMILYNISSRNSLLILSAIGVFIAPEMTPLLHKIVMVCIPLLISFTSWVLLLKLLPDRGKIKKFKAWTFVKIFHEAPWHSYIRFTGERMIFYIVNILFFYFGLKAFNLDIPMLSLAIYVPIIMLVISLPITPFGLGTSQAAILYFFKDFGTESTILAFGITYSTSILIVRWMIGLACLKIKTITKTSLELSV